MLEETGLPYEAHLVDIMENESHLPEFLALTPNGKIPAIIDPGGPGGQPLGLFASVPLLIYLADKTGPFIRADAAARSDTRHWVAFPTEQPGPPLGARAVLNRLSRPHSQEEPPSANA